MQRSRNVGDRVDRALNVKDACRKRWTSGLRASGNLNGFVNNVKLPTDAFDNREEVQGWRINPKP